MTRARTSRYTTWVMCIFYSIFTPIQGHGSLGYGTLGYGLCTRSAFRKRHTYMRGRPLQIAATTRSALTITHTLSPTGAGTMII